MIFHQQVKALFLHFVFIERPDKVTIPLPHYPCYLVPGSCCQMTVTNELGF
jgi:hypothetical protein